MAENKSSGQAPPNPHQPLGNLGQLPVLPMSPLGHSPHGHSPHGHSPHGGPENVPKQHSEAEFAERKAEIAE